MRPIDRGPVPIMNGAPKTVSDYKKWRKDLLERLGNYCCFCNITLSESLQVEHVIAQNINPAFALDWNNMLLACGACNRAKSDDPCPPDTHYLPQFHNTYLAFTTTPAVNHPIHTAAPAVYVAYRGAPASATKAGNTIQLCALDRDTTRIADQVTDLRWKFRYEAWRDARLWKQDWTDWGHQQGARFIQLLLTAAKGKGFWFVWFDVFADVSAVRQALVQHFPGTASNCFDADYNPIPRNPTNTTDPI